jgi:hypothetical protein
MPVAMKYELRPACWSPDAAMSVGYEKIRVVVADFEPAPVFK